MKISKNILMLTLLHLIVPVSYAATIYVNVAAAGGGNGTSWEQAFNNLQSALDVASVNDQIWIAKGTYIPSMPTFNLPNKVLLYGGFKGNEGSLIQRNPQVFKTILSGDLNANDLSDPANVNYAGSRTDNVAHVLTANGVIVTIDGFTIKGGNAIATNEVGGGLWASNGAKVTINNNIFSENSADFHGGAIAVQDTNSVVDILDSKFDHNYQTSPIIDSFHGGGAVSAVNDSTLNIQNSEFMQNKSGEDGSALRMESSNGTISDSTFHDNIASASGTLSITHIFELFGGSAHTVTLKNSVIKDNTIAFFGNGLSALCLFRHPASQLVLDGMVIKGGEASLGGVLNNTDCNISIKNSYLYGGKTHGAGGAISNATPFNEYFGINIPSTLNISNSIISNNVNLGDDPAYPSYIGQFIPPFTVSGIYGGGAISNAGILANLVIDNTVFSNNVTNHGSGGAILNGGIIDSSGSQNIGYGGTTVITNSVFFKNNALDGSGGAIASVGLQPVGLPNGPSLQVSNSKFLQNLANQNGNAVYINNSTSSLSNNTYVPPNQTVFTQP